MIRRATWQIRSGVGEVFLKAISDDVSLWRRNEQSLEPIQANIGDWQQSGASAASSIVERHMREGTLDDVLEAPDSVDEHPRQDIIRAALSKAALQKLDGLRDGRSFDVRGTHALVIVRTAGVIVDMPIGNRVHGWSSYRQREADLGETFEGRVDELSSQPNAGGRLELDGFRVLRGLVDPIESQPRVALEILGKS